MKVEVGRYWIYRVLCFKIMKLTKRKSFSFYRSYYDVFNELSDADKLQFIEALLDKQFLDIDPVNLNGMVKFAYISQMDSIEKQVKGYQDKTKVILNPNKGVKNTPSQGVKLHPRQQEKEEEKEKYTTTVEAEVDFLKIDEWIKEVGKSHTYLEGIYRTHKIYKGSASKLLNNFKEHLKIYPKKHNNFSDFKKHFASWLNIKNNKGELSSFKTQSKGQL